MKRMLAVLLAALLICALIPSAAYAMDEGELEIVTDPETITGEVGQVVKVNFYLYPNLPEDRVLNSIQGVLLYDADMLTYGAIITKDVDENLKSFMEDGKSTMPAVNTSEPGEIRFAYIDVYGWTGQGFWIQVEFRIEKEGACAFVFNSIRYSGLNQETKKSTSFYIEPIQAGAITTGGDEPVPSDAAAEMTYEPLAPEIGDAVTPSPSPTPKPRDDGHTVPVTSSLPQPSTETTPVPQSEGTPVLVTPAPAVTSMPVKTNPPKTETHAPASTEQAIEAANTPETNDTPTDQPDAEQTAGNDPVAEAPTDPAKTVEGNMTDPSTPTQAPQSGKEPQPETAQPSNLALTIAVIAGIVVVILLAVLAIVLILVRKKRMDAMEDDEE